MTDLHLTAATAADLVKISNEIMDCWSWVPLIRFEEAKQELVIPMAIYDYDIRHGETVSWLGLRRHWSVSVHSSSLRIRNVSRWMVKPDRPKQHMWIGNIRWSDGKMTLHGGAVDIVATASAIDVSLDVEGGEIGRLKARHLFGVDQYREDPAHPYSEGSWALAE